MMREIAPRLGLGKSIAGLRWRCRSLRDRLPFGKANRTAEVNFLASCVTALMPRRCQRGIFAAKIHFDQYITVLDNPVGRKLLDGGYFIHLFREDLLKQAVSAYFAYVTGRWGFDDAVTTPPAAQADLFDSRGIDQTVENLANDDREWRLFMARNGLSAISISYEQLCNDPVGVVAAIAQRIGIDPGGLRHGYSEAGMPSESNSPLPSKSEVARRYLASARILQGAGAAEARALGSCFRPRRSRRPRDGSRSWPVFSVIMPTRNRSALFAVALQSVLAQRFRDFELIVVNDGSSVEHEPRYRELVEAGMGVVRLLTLVRTERGHGQSYGLNYGAAQARGDYLCFLDDDDQWTDPGHLGRAAGIIAAGPERIDLILANQRAFREGTPVPGVVWIEDLHDRLRREPDIAGAFTVSPAELLACPAHRHLNATIVSRAFYLEIGGLDEGLRYECDRDFYLRAIDRATLIKFLPWVVSRHNIPDPAAKASMSTAKSELSKRLYQLGRAAGRAALGATQLRRFAMRQRAYTLKHIATEAARSGQFDCAAYYAREALMTKFTLGWLATTALFAMRRGPISPAA